MDYLKLLVEKLNEHFPNGLKLYHVTLTENVESILENGLLLEYTDCNFLHTTLGEYKYGRLVNCIHPKGFSVIEINITPDEYDRLYPEENTYFDEESNDSDSCEEREHIFAKNYMKTHPDLMGGDITVCNDIEPDKLKCIDIEGYEVSYFKTKSRVFANIEIPTDDPLFYDDKQIKGMGSSETSAFNSLKKEFELYTENPKEYKNKY